MILNFFRSGDWTSAMIGVCVSIFVVFCTLPIHEYAHAWMSTRLGDDTARLSGRLTLNPLAHIDPIGAVMILLIGFGYAKPVPVNMRNFKNPKRDMALTALAFNLLPIPPLDGSRILGLILPDQLYYKVMQYERIIMLVVLALLFFGVLSWPLSFLSNLVMKGLAFVAGLPFLPFH